LILLILLKKIRIAINWYFIKEDGFQEMLSI